jgi:hypothetical protein
VKANELLREVLARIDRHQAPINRQYRAGEWNTRMNFQYVGTYTWQVGDMRLETNLNPGVDISVYFQGVHVGSVERDEVCSALDAHAELLKGRALDAFLGGAR